MGAFCWYLLGCLIFAIGYFIYAIKFDYQNVKLAIYHSILAGIFSWLGIVFFIAIGIVCVVVEIHEWIENKLSQ